MSGEALPDPAQARRRAVWKLRLRALASRRGLLRLLRRFGLSRVLGLGLLVPLLVLRVWDPVPVEILRLKIFDLY